MNMNDAKYEFDVNCILDVFCFQGTKYEFDVNCILDVFCFQELLTIIIATQPSLNAQQSRIKLFHHLKDISMERI